ncbi:GNAT family N-acetyltransferase [Pedobacter cryoconitis]|uniref:RimJ/RimL family protein N-acetyltransferase n=1 Tax=Pedobacter cryoconitis TaxID=188932 RepID=A0A7X0ML19_9SPHI|nr:GNAT family N-acetyltransferase [Pedobacter cryoconitis]MBB6501335.1 RimJ/RimL family protein N-acetyltransferase [Pedobacter cryoconitis]
MITDKPYIFKSERLGFREWTDQDLEGLTGINTDPEVMHYFPSVQSKEQTLAFMTRMQLQFSAKGFCYFAVDKLSDQEFIGFVGLSEQTFEASFNPCIDVGWRLKKTAWNKGFATEGAERCLDYGFHQLGLKKINAMAPKVNLPSLNVMRKLGMREVLSFDHPLLLNDTRLRECVLYEKLG